MSDESATATLDAPVTSASTADSSATAETSHDSGAPTGATAGEAKWLADNLDAETTTAPAPTKPAKPTTPKPAPSLQRASDNDQLSESGDQLDPPAGEEANQETPATPANLSPDQVKLLSRFKLSPEAFQMLPEQQRAELLQSFDNHAKYTSTIAQQLAAIKRGGVQPQQQQQRGQQQPANEQQGQPPAASAGDDAWKPLATEYGQEYMEQFRGPVRAELAPLQQTIEVQHKLLSDMAQRMYVDDLDAAFDKLELPEGVDKSDQQVRQNILELAFAGMQGFSFSQRSLRSAISQAATSLYHQQATQAAADAKAQLSKQRQRGSPNRSPSHAPTTRTPISQEQRERLFLAGQDKGLEGDALQAFIRNGGH